MIDVDEYLTSQICSCCQSEERCAIANLKKIVKRKNGVYDKLPNHEIIRCNNVECRTPWQRDINAARNMRYLLIELLQGRARSKVFCAPEKVGIQR